MKFKFLRFTFGLIAFSLLSTSIISQNQPASPTGGIANEFNPKNYQ